MNIFHYDYPIGTLGIAEQNGAITRVIFGKELPAGYVLAETPVIALAAQQLREYFAGQRRDFELPLDLRGTQFQCSCWQALQTIPYGETRSYKDMATQIGNPKACRAVGLANNRNPIVIIVPCHRVLGHNGALVGFGGGLPTKQFLLDLEQGR
jgi:methylated-DNA-[protein]-cysteine S-methyltransferase